MSIQNISYSVWTGVGDDTIFDGVANPIVTVTRRQ